MLRTFRCLMATAVCAPALAAGFVLQSPDVPAGSTLKPAQVYKGYGCEGGNLAPALAWSGEPVGTRSFAITLFDPDAPTGHGWWHWLVLDLPGDTHALPAASGQPAGPALPGQAVQTRTDFGPPGFGGACPPKGSKPHRYIFTIWALKRDTLGLTAETAPAKVEAALKSEAVGKASFIAYYSR